MPTHYEVLGVDPSINQEDLRRAYVQRARALHPDRHIGDEPGRAAAAARAMQEVNEAWRVLRDPGARADYDARLRAPRRPPFPVRPVRPPSTGPTVPDLPDEPVARVVRGLPWVAAALVLAAIFVFTAYAAGGSNDGRPSPSSLVGSCVTGVGSQMTEVDCHTHGASRVDLVVVKPSLCATDASAAPYGDSWLCLRRVD